MSSSPRSMSPQQGTLADAASTEFGATPRGTGDVNTPRQGGEDVESKADAHAETNLSSQVEQHTEVAEEVGKMEVVEQAQPEEVEVKNGADEMDNAKPKDTVAIGNICHDYNIEKSGGQTETTHDNLEPTDDNNQIIIEAVKPIESQQKPLIQQLNLPTKDDDKDKNAGGKLPCLTPNKANIPRIPSPPPELKEEMERMGLTRQNSMLKYPATMVKMAKVSMSARGRPDLPRTPHSKSRSAQYYTESSPMRPVKVVRWDEANNARPPLRIDMDGPSPWSYSPHLCRPLRETVAPAFSFGRRCFVEKDAGGSRTSWQKTWFQSSDVWHQKTDFHSDRVWPSPSHYNRKPGLGKRHPATVENPSFSIGERRSTEKKGSLIHPSPGDYDPDKADNVIRRSQPSYSHSLRRGGTVCWPAAGFPTPGPGSYEPRGNYVYQTKPSFTIRGIRRQVQPQLGPYAA